MDLSSAYNLAVSVLLKSIEFKTVLGEDYEAIIDYYASVLADHGVHVTVHKVPEDYVAKTLPPQFNPERPRFILLARIGSGGRVLQFNGHYDVVPAGEGWTRQPFSPAIEDGKLYGRGATDMKGGIAAIIATLAYFAQTREPDMVVETALVPDEEIGGSTGTGYLVEQLGSRPDWVVIAEPSGVDNIYIGHRGLVWCLIKVYGKQAHGSAPWLGDNAFEKMLVFAGRFLDKYKKTISSKTSKFTYEVPDAAKPTVNPGGVLVSPGAYNIVPGVSGFSVDRRLIVEEKVEEVVDEINRLVEEISRETGIQATVEITNASQPAYTPEDSPVARALGASIERVTGSSPRYTICVGGLDLRYYTARGIHAVAYGPGEVGLAHKPDEYIDLENLRKTIQVYVDFVERLEKSLE